MAYSSSNECAVDIDTNPVDITSEWKCVWLVSGECTPASVAASLRRNTGAGLPSAVDIVVVGLVSWILSVLLGPSNFASSLPTSSSTVLSSLASLVYHWSLVHLIYIKVTIPMLNRRLLLDRIRNTAVDTLIP